jgi:hypothetical protein
MVGGDPAALARLDEPMTALRPLKGLVVIDEVQRRPDLFPALRVLADRRAAGARFLILGSASGDLLRQSSESLAGRLEHISIGGFSLEELGSSGLQDLWRRGSFPRAFPAAKESDSIAWRKHFVQTLLERDLPQWGVRVPRAALQRFWTMIAHYHGQIVPREAYWAAEADVWRSRDRGHAVGLPRGARRRPRAARAQAAPGLSRMRRWSAAEHGRARRRARRLGEAGCAGRAGILQGETEGSRLARPVGASPADSPRMGNSRAPPIHPSPSAAFSAGKRSRLTGIRVAAASLSTAT